MAGHIESIIGTVPHTNKIVDIPLDGKNLIITGGNGSGKTSFLRNAYEKVVLLVVNKQQADLPNIKEILQTFKENLAKSKKRYI